MKTKLARVYKADEIEKKKLLRESSGDLKIVLPLLQLRTDQPVCVKKLPKSQEKDYQKDLENKIPRDQTGKRIVPISISQTENLLIHREY